MWYKAADFPVEEIISRTPVCCSHNRSKRARDYLDIVTAFDIETTKIQVAGETHSIMYIWQWAFGDDVVFGRSWASFEALVLRINRALPDKVILKCGVHNLSYEFAFLKGRLKFEPQSVFCVSPRKILRADYGQIEFWCTFLHSGLSLKAWLKELHAPHQKLDGGKFDYSTVRYPWTPLSRREMMYCANDVRGVVDAIRIEMKRDGDTLCTIPLTKTGYVRRVMKEAIAENVPYPRMREMQPTFPLYLLLRDAFRGGDTHASRFYAGRILENVHHVDRSSSYPDELVNRQFPMTPFQKVGKPDWEALYAAKRHSKCAVMRVRIDHLRLKNPWRTGCPYISVDMCDVLQGCVSTDEQDGVPGVDNGRVLEADRAEFACTDIDLEIITRQYDGDSVLLELWTARYGYLPDAVRDVIRDLYMKKTALKGVKGQELIYALSKAMINACYGMTAQDPGKPVIEFIQDDPDGSQYRVSLSKSREQLVDAYARKGFLPYQIGVFVTAWARYDLHAAIAQLDELSPDSEGRYKADFVYCDTDSIFYVGDMDWSNYNEERRRRSIANGAAAKDQKGVLHCMGELEQDPREECRRFATMGAKKYAWQDKHGTLHITIAGVTKDVGARELDELGGLAKFVDREDPPTFIKAGGTAITYHDQVHFETVVDGHLLRITDNAVIEDSTYQMGTTTIYERLLNWIENNIELIEFMDGFCYTNRAGSPANK